MLNAKLMVKFGFIMLSINLALTMYSYLSHDNDVAIIFAIAAILWALGTIVWIYNAAEDDAGSS
jgi:vacuolar-type H+-ATPase subunit I/STV1